MRAQDDLQRYKLLVDKREVSRQIYDQALATAKSSTASVAAARASESAARQFVQQAQSRLAQANANHQYAQTGPQQVSSTRERVRALIADVGQKRALLEQAQLNLGYTKIVAPVSGEVNKTVVVGMNVQESGSNSSPSCRSTKFGSPPISKRRSSGKCALGRRRKSTWIRAAGRLKAMWTALRAQPDRYSACFHRRMPPGTT